MSIPDRSTWLRERVKAASKRARIRERRVRALIRMARKMDPSGEEVRVCIVCGETAVFHGLTLSTYGASPVQIIAWCAKDECVADMHSTEFLPVRP